LKLGLIIYGSLETLTGGYLYDRKLVEHLRGNGDEVQIFSIPWRNYGKHLLDNATSKLLRSLSESSLDLLLEDELNHPSLFLINRRLRPLVHCPIVSVVHHLRCKELRPAWQNGLYKIIEKDYLSTVDGFVFNGQTTRATVEELVGNRRPSVIAFPGKDSIKPDPARNEIERRARRTEPLRVLFVGSLIPRKELHTLIAALARLPRENWRLDVIGSPETDPTYSARIKDQIDRNGLAESVTLLGSMPAAQLAEYYSKSHVLAVPSSFEGFGIVYLEGMGFGLPAIASTAGAAHEIVTHGRNGFLVDPGDAESLAGLLDRLHRDREELVRMSFAALDRYAIHPTWEECAESIRKFLQEIIK
jgi:glycosyltransferase involved in cell wall biosynthesis